MTTPWARDERGAAVLELVVVPRASRTRVVGEHDGRLRLQLAAPPVDGAANEALLAFLAEVLSVRRSAIGLVRGEAGRRKTVRVEGLDAARAAERLGGA